MLVETPMKNASQRSSYIKTLPNPLLRQKIRERKIEMAAWVQSRQEESLRYQGRLRSLYQELAPRLSPSRHKEKAIIILFKAIMEEAFKGSHMETGFDLFDDVCPQSQLKGEKALSEIIGYTSMTLKTSFDFIGKRYKGTHYFLDVLESGQDPFEGKFFLRILQRITHTTTYFINFSVLYAFLEQKKRDLNTPDQTWSLLK